MREITIYRNGRPITLYATPIGTYAKGMLFFIQERLLLTDLQGKEIDSMDIIDFITPIK